MRAAPVRGPLAETVLSVEDGTLRFRNRQVTQRVDEVLCHVQSSALNDAHTTLVFTQPRPFKLPILLRLRAERTEQRTITATLTIVDLERRHHLPETLL
ncbi:MAG: LuxR family transcriptional regulator, partial [Oxalobacteraceae bacterium]